MVVSGLNYATKLTKYTKEFAIKDTALPEYAARLKRLETVWWKKVLDVQRPYRWNLRRLKPGFTLDVGCGIGRNLANLAGQGIGVDHNPSSVPEAKKRGFKAFTVEDFLIKYGETVASDSKPFDSILIAHVLEHLDLQASKKLLQSYLPYLKKDGQVIIICPQESGHASDTTHVEYMNAHKIQKLGCDAGLTLAKSYSFPFPFLAGKFFKYNETVVVFRKS